MLISRCATEWCAAQIAGCRTLFFSEYVTLVVWALDYYVIRDAEATMTERVTLDICLSPSSAEDSHSIELRISAITNPFCFIRRPKFVAGSTLRLALAFSESEWTVVPLLFTSENIRYHVKMRLWLVYRFWVRAETVNGSFDFVENFLLRLPEQKRSSDEWSARHDENRSRKSISDCFDRENLNFSTFIRQ